MEQQKLINQYKMINEFYFDLTIKWELFGYDYWTELVNINGDVFADEVVMPVFRYFLRWAEKFISFLIMYRSVEDHVYEGAHELQIVDVYGDEPEWNWLRQLNIDNLYAEAEVQSYAGKETGVIIPTWLSFPDLHTY